jgi:ParB family chromosome partitioning protein
VLELPLSAIRPNPHQPRRRLDETALEELAASIRLHGLVQPVIVAPDGEGYVLVAGERRWRAAARAGLERIPALVRELDPRAMTELALVENLQREDLNPLEEAYAYRLLQEEYGLTQDEIAHRVGKSRPHVANILRLLQLDPAVQEAVMEGQLTGGHAKVLVSLPPALQRSLAEEALRRRWSVRELERRLRSLRDDAGPRRQGVEPPSNPELAHLEQRLRERLGSPVAIRRRDGGAGWIEIRFFGEEDLARLVDALLG